MPFFCILLFFIYSCLNGQADEPIAVYLTWQNDPTSTMTINWISDTNQTDDLVTFKPLNNGLWSTAVGLHRPLPHDYPAIIHHVELKNLLPDSEYHFKIGENETTYKFRTLPNSLVAPLRFVVGGDIFHDSVEALEETNMQAARTNPAFALQGGDLGYSSKKVQPWITWLQIWTKTMLSTDGCCIPMIAALGNHDVEGHYGDNPAHAPIFSALLRASDQTAFYTFDAGDYLAITVLDSGHTNAIDGKQVDWLKEVLDTRAHFKHKFALYHLPAYPSARKYDSKRAPLIRKYWVPLFEKFSLHAAFENHDHCYKRSILLKEGMQNPQGVLYLGDGAWGVSAPRKPKEKAEETWYLAKTAAKRHFILVTIQPNGRSFEAIDHIGRSFDYYEN